MHYVLNYITSLYLIIYCPIYLWQFIFFLLQSPNGIVKFYILTILFQQTRCPIP